MPVTEPLAHAIPDVRGRTDSVGGYSSNPASTRSILGSICDAAETVVAMSSAKVAALMRQACDMLMRDLRTGVMGVMLMA